MPLIPNGSSRISACRALAPWAFVGAAQTFALRRGYLRRVASVGDVFGARYRLESLLGIGGMGQVFAAHDELLDRRVAVKLPSKPSNGASERFRREARSAASLNHPNVVSVYDWGED